MITLSNTLWNRPSRLDPFYTTWNFSANNISFGVITCFLSRRYRWGLMPTGAMKRLIIHYLFYTFSSLKLRHILSIPLQFDSNVSTLNSFLEAISMSIFTFCSCMLIIACLHSLIRLALHGYSFQMFQLFFSFGWLLPSCCESGLKIASM